VLALPALLTALDIGALFLALPHLSADLGTTTVQQLWISDIYGFLIAGFLITMGTLGDRVGRRKLLLIGGAIFGVMSVLAAYSSSPEMLIATRALLGIAGATLMPSTLALISNMFHDVQQRSAAIGILYSCLMVGSALGPVVGGLMLARFWWGSVFLLGVPVMALLLVVGPMLLPEYRNPDAGRLDLISVVLSLAAILPIIYGIKELAVHGWSVPRFVTLVAGLVIGVLFVQRQRRLRDPLVDVSLFGQRSFTAVVTALLVAGAAMAGTFLLVSQYIQTVLDYSAPAAGLLLAPTGLSIAAGALAAPAIGKRLGVRNTIAGGLAVAALGYVLIIPASSSGGLVGVVIGLAVVHFCVGPLLALGTGLVIGAVPPERAGSAASISETSNYLGSTIGMAVLGTVAAAVYLQRMVDGVPADVPAGDARAAQETLAGAVDAAGRLAEPAASQLLRTARDAFTTGLNIAGVIGVVVFAVLVFVILAGLREPAKTGASAQEPEVRVPEPQD
jgi:MFS transporter, DHA2 family, multidrug resistance protein